MKLSSCVVPVFCVLILFAMVTQAEIIHVPADYATIQAGIDASSYGDSVLVADGIYTGVGNMDLTTRGRSITVMSENGPATCIIDCAHSGIGFRVTESETQSTVISGFTIINGITADYGGGIYCSASPRIHNCIVQFNTAEYGGGIAIQGEQTMPLLEECIVTDNTSQYGGGVYVSESSGSPSGTACLANMVSKSGTSGDYRASGPNVTIEDSAILGNNAYSGGGYYCTTSESNISDTAIASNTAMYKGGGLHMIVDSTCVLSRCVLAGNTASYGGAVNCESNGMYTIDTCVFMGNSASTQGGALMDDCYPECYVLNSSFYGNASDRGGAYLSTGALYDQVANSIFAGNTGHAVYMSSESYSFSTFQNNLFYDNPDGDYYDNVVESITGADVINATFGFAMNNIGGDPLFVQGAGGAWSETPIYDSVYNRSTLTDTAALFVPGELVGTFIIPDTSQMSGAWITANTETTVTVIGDVTGWVVQGDSYQIRDFHLQDGSNALHRAAGSYAGVTDIEDDPRPGTDGRYDIGADEAPSEYEPPPDTDVPESYVEDLPEITMNSTVSISYYAADATSGVQYVELFYRLNSGDWEQYSGQFEFSPISFDTTTTGGDGFYEFYTLATDNADNKELPPNVPDASTNVVSEFPGGTVYVDMDAVGLGTGVDWANAITTITGGLNIALTMDVETVWVAEGRYMEALDIPSDVEVYGGFDGSEANLWERDFRSNLTIIDASTAEQGDPAAHAVTIRNVENVWFDGFVITGAMATESGDDSGGGILCENLDKDVSIVNCTIMENHANHGGGIYCRAASNAISNCLILNNTAETGGGIRCDEFSKLMDANGTNEERRSTGTSPFITSCTVAANESTSGGGICCGSLSAPVIYGSNISGNTAQDGGGIYAGYLSVTDSSLGVPDNRDVSGPNPRIINSSVSGNYSQYGGGIYSLESDLELVNSTIRSNNAGTQGRRLVRI